MIKFQDKVQGYYVSWGFEWQTVDLLFCIFSQHFSKHSEAAIIKPDGWKTYPSYVMTRPACARIFQCQNSYRQALAVQEIVMLYLEAEMDKFFFYMNEHQPSHAQFLAILIPTQSAHPIPLCLHLKEPSHRIGQIYSNWKQAGGGGGWKFRKCYMPTTPRQQQCVIPHGRKPGNFPSLVCHFLHSTRFACSNSYCLREETVGQHKNHFG